MIADKRSKNFGKKTAERQVIIKVLICSKWEDKKIIKAQNPEDSGIRGGKGLGEISVRIISEPPQSSPQSC